MDVSNCKKSSQNSTIGCAQRLHPEDLSVGDWVVVSLVQCELPSFLWCSADSLTMPPEQPVRIAFKPCAQQLPLRIRKICFPYVLCWCGSGEHRVLDVRQIELMKLDRNFAKSMRQALKHTKSKSKKKRRRSK